MLARSATAIANWGGLKPAAIVLLAVPAGLVAGIVVSFLSSIPLRQPAGQSASR